MTVGHEEQLARRQAIRVATTERLTTADGAMAAGWGRSISSTILAILDERGPATVFTYLNMPEEAPTQDIVRALLADERMRVVVPRVVTGSEDMTLHEITDLGRDVRPGLWGIPTPRTRCPVTEGSEVDIVLVPMVAFDDEGWRIGHGGGYYDRFLSANPRAHRLGVAFELQRVDGCLPQSWDERLDALVTEDGVRRFVARAGQGS
ncbi:5-formyltetrahydrofolate cyclo-ligase [Candidatus Poribacteria bacterium]|nr:5-formyltetrahydrofolate cyclo-ligase [Candidatus Poribacteria bacterium]